MATLNVRKLPDAVYRRLRLRAAQAGRSMEAEARAIITAACSDETRVSAADLQDFVDQLYEHKKPEGVVDALIVERRREAEREARAEAHDRTKSSR